MKKQENKKIIKNVKKALKENKTFLLSTKECRVFYGNEPDVVNELMFITKDIYEQAKDKEILEVLIKAAVMEENEGEKLIKDYLDKLLTKVKEYMEESEDE